MAEKKDKLQAKLRRLGVVKGARNLKPAPPPDPSLLRRQAPSAAESDFDPDDPQPLEALLPGGRLEETAEGQCFVLDKVYPLSYQHGRDRLAHLLVQTPETAAVFCRDERLEQLDMRDFLFLDTETTGLAGAGTIPFMVGVGFFEPGAAENDDAFVVRQYFLRDHGDEPAMLLLLDELLAEKPGLITFNGRSFDLPLLDARYLMNRMPSDVRERPHLDLLPPARRLWRHRLGSCALSDLEPSLLGLQRTHEDVPGWLIPSLYHDYVRSGDARELIRVFYHNRIDVASMVTLAGRILRFFSRPDDTDHPIDLYSLGKWQADLGLAAEAEQNLRRAAQGDLPLELFHRNLHRLGLLLKQNGRRAEAVPIWRQIAATSFDDVSAHVELAKFYEWHEKDLLQARQWTEDALELVDGWPPAQAALVHDELEHRLARLQHKLEGRR